MYKNIERRKQYQKNYRIQRKTSGQKTLYQLAKERLARYKEEYGLGAGTVNRYGLKLALKIYEKYQRKCTQCDSNNDLVIHHLDNQGRHNIKIGKSPNNSEDNLILLCQRCHSHLHNPPKIMANVLFRTSPNPRG